MSRIIANITAAGGKQAAGEGVELGQALRVEQVLTNKGIDHTSGDIGPRLGSIAKDQSERGNA